MSCVYRNSLSGSGSRGPKFSLHVGTPALVRTTGIEPPSAFVVASLCLQCPLLPCVVFPDRWSTPSDQLSIEPRGQREVWTHKPRRRAFVCLPLVTTVDRTGYKTTERFFGKDRPVLRLQCDTDPRGTAFLLRSTEAFQTEPGSLGRVLRGWVLCCLSVPVCLLTLPLKYFRIQPSLPVFILQGLWLRSEH